MAKGTVSASAEVANSSEYPWFMGPLLIGSTRIFQAKSGVIYYSTDEGVTWSAGPDLATATTGFTNHLDSFGGVAASIVTDFNTSTSRMEKATANPPVSTSIATEATTAMLTNRWGVRTTGEVVAVGSITNRVMGSDYIGAGYAIRSTGGTWSASLTQYSTGGEVNESHHGALVIGNRAHLIYRSGNNYVMRTLSASNTLSAGVTIGVEDGTGQPNLHFGDVASASDSTGRFYYTTQTGWVKSFVSADSPTITNEKQWVTAGVFVNHGGYVVVDPENDQPHVIMYCYSSALNGGTGGFATYYATRNAGVWTTPAFLRNEKIRGASYFVNADGARVIGYVYDVWDTTGLPGVYYDEYVIEAGAVPPSEGSGSGTASWTGTADGQAPTDALQGSGVGTVSWTGTASGERPPALSDWSAVVSATTLTGVPNGAGAGTVLFTGTTAGAKPHSGESSGATLWTQTATGEAPSAGSGVGAAAWASAAAGSAPYAGSGVSTATWSGTGAGVAPIVGDSEGGVVGAVLWTAVVTGSTVREGAAAGTTVAASAASGRADHYGTSVGATSWAATTQGSADLLGSASGTHDWTATAPGGAGANGAGVGAHAWAGTSSGARISAGSADGVVVFLGTAAGGGPAAGAATGSFLWVGVARQQDRDITLLGFSQPFLITVGAEPELAELDGTDPTVSYTGTASVLADLTGAVPDNEWDGEAPETLWVTTAPEL